MKKTLLRQASRVKVSAYFTCSSPSLLAARRQNIVSSANAHKSRAKRDLVRFRLTISLSPAPGRGASLARKFMRPPPSCASRFHFLTRALYANDLLKTAPRGHICAAGILFGCHSRMALVEWKSFQLLWI